MSITSRGIVLPVCMYSKNVSYLIYDGGKLSQFVHDLALTVREQGDLLYKLTINLVDRLGSVNVLASCK